MRTLAQRRRYNREWNRTHPEAHRAANARWRKAHPEQAREMVRRCWIESGKKYRRVQYKKHAKRIKARNRAWQLAHPEQMRELRARWRRKYPERARAAIRCWARAHPAEVAAIQQRAHARRRGARTTERFLDIEIYRRDHWRCGICHRRVRRADATLDHRVPVSKGGKHTRANVQCAHRRCNSRKGAR